jgi:hypothetical protein
MRSLEMTPAGREARSRPLSRAGSGRGALELEPEPEPELPEAELEAEAGLALGPEEAGWRGATRGGGMLSCS